MRIKEEMIKITKRLQKAYPEKHIHIAAASEYYHYSSNRGEFRWSYLLYVEDCIRHKKFNSLKGLVAYIDMEEIDAKGEPTK